MKLISLILLVILSITISCSSTIYLPKSNEYRLNRFDEIIILKNDHSFLIPFRKYPGHNEIRYMVKDTIPAIEPVFSLIKEELKTNGFKCTIWETLPNVGNNTIYLTYQDYWAWDFKKYMHMLVINVFNPQDEIIFKVVSYSNSKGMHNYPTPTKQVPLMIDELTKHLNP